MNHKRDFDRAVDRWLDDGSHATPPKVIEAVLLAVRNTSQERDFRLAWRTSLTKRFAYAVAAIAALAVGLTSLAVVGPRFGIGSGPSATEDPSVDLGIFEPVAGRIVYGDARSIWGVDTVAPADPATRVLLSSVSDIPLGWSSDGTRLLITRGIRGQERLFVIRADGSETQLTTDPMLISGATISPDGSRVVFAGGEGTLYVVDADGGPAEMLLGPGEHDVQQPTFSPDGRRIAYTSGGGDHSNDVWVMDADGSDAHQIVSNEWTARAGHVRGLAWSPAGDRIALGLEGTIYTFATDGSGFTEVIAHGDQPYWSPDGSRFAYTCVSDLARCGLSIADADGSNVREFGYGASGPWHPSEFVIENISGGGDHAFLNYAELHAPYSDGWEFRLNTLSRGDVVGISAWSIDGVYADPCRWETSLVPLEFDGSWFETFTQTLMQQPGRNPKVVDTGLDFGGWAVAGTIELSVPADLDVEVCDRGVYNVWRDISDRVTPAGNWNHEQGQTDIVYAVNVDRNPVIIDVWLRAGATAEDHAALETMLAEIHLDL
ncbi:MAG: LpqB family beta-propeller domain-containing protein [Chloroflexota bacterium]